jgi:hypothetical protein
MAKVKASSAILCFGDKLNKVYQMHFNAIQNQNVFTNIHMGLITIK